jgi:hypothetical protein
LTLEATHGGPFSMLEQTASPLHLVKEMMAELEGSWFLAEVMEELEGGLCLALEQATGLASPL